MEKAKTRVNILKSLDNSEARARLLYSAPSACECFNDGLFLFSSILKAVSSNRLKVVNKGLHVIPKDLIGWQHVVCEADVIGVPIERLEVLATDRIAVIHNLVILQAEF